jgi:thioesterase domain-containing protein/NAD(P)-dependent dehydrogenase (short-subunit alcohol dehydrogenase family)
MTDGEATDPTYWPRHLRGTVRFNDGIQKVLDAKHVLLEVGPGRGLASLARQQPVRPVAMATTLPHPKERGSDRAFLMGALGRLWVAGVALDETKLFAGEERRRVPLPSYPFERQRYWVDADPENGPRTRDEELTKQTDIGEWFYAPSWGRAAPAGRKEATEGRATWLVFTDGSPLAKRLVDGLERSQDRVVAVRPGRVFAAVDATTFVIDPANPSDYDRLARELRSLDLVPGRLLHLWSLSPRRIGLRLPLRRGPRVVADYSRHLALDYYSLVFFAQAFAEELDSLGVTVVSSHMQAVPGDAELDPEKAVLLGACKVIPREYPQIACASVDVVHPRSRSEVERLASQLLGELRGEVTEGEIALRGADRWVRRFDRVRLPADEGQRDWLQTGGVYLVTGGLGGIGLTVAEHLARHARAKLVLVGRRPLPVDEDSWIATHGPLDETSRKIAQVRAMRDLGAEVMTAAADVGDFDSMRDLMARVHERFGRVNGVFHVAGQLKDEIIALRARRPESPLIDVKMKGAIVLDELVRADRPELFVLFSSVSSILGLPGQADYTAANRFLDAFALARAAQNPATRTLSVDWNAWQGVGLLARSTRLPGTAHPMLTEVVRDEGEATLFRTPLQRSAHWMLAEHVVRGGMALIPGTGLLEIARAALEHRREERAVELRDVVFLAPVAVGPDEPRTLHVRVDRSGDRGFLLYGNSEQETFVTGRVAYVDAPPAERCDLGAIRARCTREGAIQSGFLVQHFMDFGPRWGCIDSMRLGAGEALLELALPEAFAADRDVFRLHPALLDMAVGAAQALLPDFDPTADFYVPLSYGRVLLRRAMPARLFSHVRLRPNGTRHTATFDVTLVDQDLEEIASIEGFVMCRVTPGALAAVTEAPSKETERATRRSESPEEAALRVGMTAPEGMEALDRMLAAPVAPQIVACSLDLDAWLERVAREQRASSRPEGTVAASAPLFTRPNLGVTFVGPRDPIEHELAAIWRELLGVAEVGVHDDFFELGGQSLVAVRMFHRIGKKFRVELALATLFEAPTIAGCAALLRERLGPSDAITDAAPVSIAAEGKPARVVPLPRAPRALVTIQAGERGVPFFCVHGAGGNVLNLRDLARAVGPSQPFYGLQAHGVDGATPPHETIEEMASAYVAELREVQSEGPYMLGGYSGGGLVAFEMAQQLTAAGHEVKLLAFIDTFHPRMALRAMTTRTRLARLRDERLRYVAEAAARPWERLRHASRLRAIEDHRARGEVVPLALREVYMTRRFVNAASRYEPKAWAGRATLFQAEELAYVFRDAGPAYGWHRHVLGGVDVVRVPGDHSTIVLGDNAAVIGRELRAALDRVAPSAEQAGRVEGAQAPRSRRGEAVAVDSTG